MVFDLNALESTTCDNWDAYIQINALNRVSSSGRRYETGLDKELLKYCQKHSHAQRKATSGENIVMLVHPFYTQLSHSNQIPSVMEPQLAAYTVKLNNFLRMNRDESDVGFVLVDTLHHYAARTHSLVDEKLVDDVIFTEYDSGEPLNPWELSLFAKKETFFAGGYNGICLTDFIEKMRNFTLKENCWAIRELALESPVFSREDFVPKRVYGVKRTQNISLNQAIEMLNLH